MWKGDGALLTDLYQLNMMAAYLEHGLTETAVFELFVRKLPSHRGFLMAAGLEQALQFLEPSPLPRTNSTPSAAWASFPKASSPGSSLFASPAMSTRCPRERCSFPTSLSCAWSHRYRRRSSSRPASSICSIFRP
jgi:hypothetical protein